MASLKRLWKRSELETMHVKNALNRILGQRNDLLKCLGIALGYFLCARLGMSFGVTDGNISPLWPAAGVAMASLVMLGWQFWPGVFLGSVAAVAMTGAPTLFIIGAAVAASVEACVVAVIMKRRTVGEPLNTLKAFGTLLFASVAGAAIGSFLGACAASAANIAIAPFRTNIFYWFIGDLFGCLVVSPLILSWWDVRAAIRAVAHWRSLILFSVPVLITYLCFFDLQTLPVVAMPLMFMALPNLFGNLQLSTVTLFVQSALVALASHQGAGPFYLSWSNPNEAAVLSSVYLSFSAFFSLLTSVLLTKNKRIMTQMREERNLLGAILENNADGWCEWNMRRPDEHYLSPKLKSVLGYEDHEIPNNREGLNMLIHPDDRHMVDCIMKEQLEGRGDSNISLEIRHVHKSGETRWALCKAKAFKDEIGGLKRIIGLHIDISYQKSMEDELRSAKLDAEAGARAKADFLARMSHEIRTPLNGIIGLISMFGSTKLDEKQMEMHGLLRQSSQTLLDLLNDILDLAKLEASEDKVEPVQLKDVVESVVGLFWARAGDKGLYLTAHVPRDAHVRVNKSKLMQVLVNLVSNAIKYTKTGGIRVSAERTGSDELTFTIADSGIGISPGEIERIFDEYHQGSAHVAKRFGGTGLGLAICKELTEAMGGRIWVKSRLGVGSTFCFTVRGEPVPKVPVKASRALTNDQTFSMLKVLVVEDYPVNQKVAMYNFQCLGIHPEVVNNGKEALEHPRLNEFDAVFMDVHMPIMDGYEAAAQIRRRAQDRSRPKIIAMTAYALKGDRERCVEAGMDDYIAKPIDAQSLFSCLGRHFGKADCIPVTFNAKEVRARFADSKTLLLEVLKGSELSYGACIQEMKNAVSSGDATRLGAAVHKLRGGLLTFGQNEVVEKLRQVEHSAREDGVVSLTESEVDILREQIRSLMDQLHHFAETIGEMPDAPRPEVHP